MTLTLNLPPELEQYLLREAQSQGLSVEAITVALLNQSLLPKQQPVEAAEVLRSWAEDGGIEPLFNQLVKQWPADTRFLSSAYQIMLNVGSNSRKDNQTESIVWGRRSSRDFSNS